MNEPFITNKKVRTGACFRATNVFSFEALFANNPFWCLKRKHVSNSRLGKTQPNHGVGYRKSKQIQDGGKSSHCYNDFFILNFLLCLGYHLSIITIKILLYRVIDQK